MTFNQEEEVAKAKAAFAASKAKNDEIAEQKRAAAKQADDECTERRRLVRDVAKPEMQKMHETLKEIGFKSEVKVVGDDKATHPSVLLTWTPLEKGPGYSLNFETRNGTVITPKKTAEPGVGKPAGPADDDIRKDLWASFTQLSD